VTAVQQQQQQQQQQRMSSPVGGPTMELNKSCLVAEARVNLNDLAWGSYC